MKRICFLLLFAMTAVMSAAATPAAATAKPAANAKTTATPTATPAAANAKPAGPVLSSIYSPGRAPSEFAEPDKAADLLKRRAELAQKIQNERKRILKEDAAAKKLSEEIMLLNRRLASVLESRKSMIELNSQLREIDDAISRLKPAPAPASETKDTKKEDAGNAGNADKAGNAGKE